MSQILESQQTPYLALAGELWGVCCEDFGENWPCHNSTTLYLGDTGTMLSSEPMTNNCQWDPWENNFNEICMKHIFFFNKMYLKMLSAICQPFCSGLTMILFWEETSPLAPGKFGTVMIRSTNTCYQHITYQVHVHFLWNCTQVNSTEHFWW